MWSNPTVGSWHSMYPSGKRSNFFFISFHDHLTPKNTHGRDATDIARYGKNIIKIDLLSSSSSGGGWYTDTTTNTSPLAYYSGLTYTAHTNSLNTI